VTGRLFVISGPSGVGKGTLIALVRERMAGLDVAVSATTRPQRPGEVDGREYHFLDEGRFQQLVEEGAFLEHVPYAGHRYGTLRSEVERRLEDGRSVVLEIDVPGAREIKRQMPDAVLVFIAPPDVADLERRLAGRGANTAVEIDARLEIARREMSAATEFGNVIINDDRDRAAAELEQIIQAALATRGADR
jgi:guanylate kinase